MNIDQIQYFLKASETESLSAAAKEYHISPQGISYSILALEEELHVQLFVRSKSGVSLTPYGKAILPYAKQIVSSYHSMYSVIISTRKMAQGTLLIAAQQGTSSYFTTDIITSFMRSYPSVKVEVFVLTDYEVDKAVLSGKCNIGFSSGILSSDLFNIIPIRESTFCALIPSDHPLATHERLTIKDLKDQPICIGFDQYKYHSFFCQKMSRTWF